MSSLKIFRELKLMTSINHRSIICFLNLNNLKVNNGLIKKGNILKLVLLKKNKSRAKLSISEIQNILIKAKIMRIKTLKIHYFYLQKIKILL